MSIWEDKSVVLTNCFQMWQGDHQMEFHRPGNYLTHCCKNSKRMHVNLMPKMKKEWWRKGHFELI